MGTPDFAVESLRALVDGGYNVVGVITAPDKPAGRGQKLKPSAVKAFALERGLTVLQPEKLKDEVFISKLRSLKPDLQVVVAFRMLPEVVWNMPPLGTFNLHASLLPAYRGAAPLNWAIINGEIESGVTTFKLQHEIDTGNIIFQEKTTIAPDDNVEVLHDKLMAIGARLVVQTVDVLADGDFEFVKQQDLIDQGIEPTPAPKIFKEDCRIDWNTDAVKICNLVRGLSPYPAAWTNLVDADGKEIMLKVFNVSVGETCNQVPGTIETDGKLYLGIASSNAWLRVNELQLSGKKRMKVDDFLRGFQNIGKCRAK
ncbi:MAG: methionyl-tRNA formyltransferase [Prolixibacteraceae bacterium]|nr:methionyl-tRNA formyltransferase [Prolixibacteraceae bacterium]MBN2649570.1 methionyl-tRNA formyltransferase [Prolixibacteraceae bacterium]